MVVKQMLGLEEEDEGLDLRLEKAEAAGVLRLQHLQLFLRLRYHPPARTVHSPRL